MSGMEGEPQPELEEPTFRSESVEVPASGYNNLFSYVYGRYWLGTPPMPAVTPNSMLSDAASISSTLEPSASQFSNFAPLPAAPESSSTEALPELRHVFVRCALLSYWDDREGPKIERVWRSTQDDSDEDLLMYVSRHTLNGEMMRPSTEDIEPRLYVLGDQGVAVTSFIFSGYSGAQTSALTLSKYSLSVLVPMHLLQPYLVYYPLIAERLPRILARHRVVQKKLAVAPLPAGGRRPSSADHLSRPLLEMLCSMEELYEHHIPADYSLSETIFGSEYEGTYSDRPFLWRAFSSHLQTHCRTVVLGHDLHTVNIFINSLALLMPLAQRKCSRRARKDTFRKNLNVFYPEAFVQGLILTPDTDRASILQDMHALESPFPVTVVDLTRQLVEQTEVLSAYSRTRDECFKDELQNEHTAETAASLIASGLFRPTKEFAPFVKQMIAEAYRLPYALRKQHLAESRRIVERRAQSLLTRVDEHIQDSAASRNLPHTVLKRVRAELGLDDNISFYIVLAEAERMRPGSFMEILADPHSMAENLREMMDGF